MPSRGIKKISNSGGNPNIVDAAKKVKAHKSKLDQISQDSYNEIDALSRELEGSEPQSVRDIFES